MAQAIISSYPVSYTTSGSLRGTNYQNAIGKGADTAAASGNDYCSSRNSYAYVYYTFDFSSIPNGANIISVACQVKGHAENTSQSSERARCQLYVGTSTAKGSYSDFTSTSAQTLTLTTGTWTYEEVQDMTLCFTMGYYGGLVNGATVTVTYELSDPRTVTTTLSGNGTIDPSGAQTYYDGDEYTLTITPTTKSDTVTVTNNGTDVTSELIEHYSGGTSTSTSAVAGSNVTTGFYRSGGAFYQSSSTSSDAWLRYAIGHSAESPYSTSNTSNTYVKDGTNDANTMGWMNYPFDFSGLPNDAEVTAVEVKCYGATESTSESARHADVELYCGSELKSTRQSFTSTSNQTITINNPGTWTREELQNAQLRFIVGYYGGRILGITWKITYTHGGTLSYYTYSYTVSGNATIAVTIGGGGGGPKLYIKQDSSETLVYSQTNNSSDSNLRWQTHDGDLYPGDVIKVVLTNIEGYESGRAWISEASDEITVTLTGTSGTERFGDKDIKLSVSTSASTYSGTTHYTYNFTLYYLHNGAKCSFTGIMQIYKVTSTGSWVSYTKAYKKVNGSWVQQSDLTNVFDSTKNWVKG